MTLVRTTSPPSMTGLIFALLLATIFAHIWFGSTPLPFGGPNVILAALAVILSLAHVVSRVLRPGTPSATVHTLIKDFRPVLPTVVVSLLLLLWALAVYLFTDTLRPTRLATMGMGIGILFAVYLSVDSVYRATLLALAIILATAVSTLFGMAVTFLGDPFLTIWLQIATVKEHLLHSVLTEGRTAGLSPDTITLSYQLAVALPLAFAAFLSRLFGHGKGSRLTSSTVLYTALASMVIGITVNATRAAILGVLVAAVIIVLLSPRSPQMWRRLLFLVPLIPLWLLVFSDTPLTTSGDRPTLAGLTLAGPADIPRRGHTFTGLTPGQVYTVQLRARDAQGYGPPSPELTAAPKPDGSLTLTWQAPANPPTGYQLRLRTAANPTQRSWQSFRPSLRSAAPSSPSGQGPSIVGLTTAELTTACPRRGLTLVGLTPGQVYTVQLRARDARGYGPPSPEVTATAGQYGSFVITWQDPTDPPTGYQFQHRRADDPAWWPWETFIPACDEQPRDGKRVAARSALNTFEKTSHLGANLLSFSHTATRGRIPMASMALRHSLAHPLGTGDYSPGLSHLPAGLPAPMVNWLSTHYSPHNQFLVILVYYGFPGLILLLLFYALVLRSLLHSRRLLIHSPDTAPSFLLAAITGALAGYGINSLLHNAGPFVGDWSHFFLVGLAFSLRRIAASRQANEALPQP